MTTTVLCVGAGSEQIPAIMAAHRLGLRVVAVDIRSDAPALALADVGLHINTADENAVIGIAEQHSISAVLPAPIGRYLTTVGAVNDALELRGVSRTAAKACTDKWKFHQLLAQSGLNQPRRELVDNASNLSDVLHKIGLPCVVKPRFGSGSRGVMVINTLMQAVKLQEQFDQNAASILVEEFVEGVALGVDAVMQSGKCEVVLLREKQLTPLPYRVEMTYLGPARLSDVTSARIHQTVQRCAMALGLDNCLLHADLIIPPATEPVVIEMSGRPSGLSISSKMVPLATGVDFLVQGINLVLGKPTQFLARQGNPVVLKYLPIAPGRIMRSPTSTVLRTEEGLLEFACPVKVGDVLQKITTAQDSLSRGYVLTTGSNLAAALLTADKVIASMDCRLIKS